MLTICSSARSLDQAVDNLLTGSLNVWHSVVFISFQHLRTNNNNSHSILSLDISWTSDLSSSCIADRQWATLQCYYSLLIVLCCISSQAKPMVFKPPHTVNSVVSWNYWLLFNMIHLLDSVSGHMHYLFFADKIYSS